MFLLFLLFGLIVVAIVFWLFVNRIFSPLERIGKKLNVPDELIECPECHRRMQYHKVRWQWSFDEYGKAKYGARSCCDSCWKAHPVWQAEAKQAYKALEQQNKERAAKRRLEADRAWTDWISTTRAALAPVADRCGHPASARPPYILMSNLCSGASFRCECSQTLRTFEELYKHHGLGHMDLLVNPGEVFKCKDCGPIKERA